MKCIIILGVFVVYGAIAKPIATPAFKLKPEVFGADLPADTVKVLTKQIEKLFELIHSTRTDIEHGNTENIFSNTNASIASLAEMVKPCPHLRLDLLSLTQLVIDNTGAVNDNQLTRIPGNLDKSEQILNSFIYRDAKNSGGGGTAVFYFLIYTLSTISNSN